MNSFLSVLPSDSISSLSDKAATLNSLISLLKNDIQTISRSVSQAYDAVHLTKGRIRSIASVKLENPVPTSAEQKTLIKAKELLEENIVQVKLKLATIRTELENEEDLKNELVKTIAEKESNIKGLSEEIEFLRAEKSALIYSQQNTQGQARRVRTEVRRGSFPKNLIKPFPTASFQFSIKVESDREASLEENASELGEKSTKRQLTEGSLRASEI